MPPSLVIDVKAGGPFASSRERSPGLRRGACSCQLPRAGLGSAVRDVVFARRRYAATAGAVAETRASTKLSDNEKDMEWDAIVIGSGMGGLTTAAQLAAKKAKVLVLEKYIIPGGSAAHYDREGCRFDVGSSMMFGFGDKGTTNLLTRALASVGKRIETIPDPVQIDYHLPKSSAHPTGLRVAVHRDYRAFVDELASRFPHEREGIEAFYSRCWIVFDALNSIDLKSLEEPLYLLTQFLKNPVGCLQLAWYLPQNAGDVARRFIRDEELLSFIDMECYCWSTVQATRTPMINAGMVFCDRHFGGINYPRGGVGRIPELMAEGIEEQGGRVIYKANVSEIVTEDGEGEVRAKGVKMRDGTVLRAKTVVSNATRWDTFENLVQRTHLPDSEAEFFKRYKKSPSFLTIHMVVDASVIPSDCYCHHIVLEDWTKLEDPLGTLFVSIPTVLDPTLAPEGKHIVHAFSPDWIDEWSDLAPADYRARKDCIADDVAARLEEAFLPGLREAVSFREVGTPRTHRKFLNRSDGTYGPIPLKRPVGLLGMPFNRTDIDGLYCVGDSTFPGQGVNAVAFSGFACAHRVASDLGFEPRNEVLDKGLLSLFSFFRTIASKEQV